RTVRLAHQITMAGDKVLSGDCRFVRRNYFPVARKEIVARVTMARNPLADGPPRTPMVVLSPLPCGVSKRGCPGLLFLSTALGERVLTRN
ncbi:hypothetical protein X777_14610, partial [Ooceraea biroi]